VTRFGVGGASTATTHKEMGHHPRGGAWESVAAATSRHLGPRSPTATTFTVAGIGDMSGDGLRQTRCCCCRSTSSSSPRSITGTSFLDPETGGRPPSFAERPPALFQLRVRRGADYDTSLLSAGRWPCSARTLKKSISGLTTGSTGPARASTRPSPRAERPAENDPRDPPARPSTSSTTAASRHVRQGPRRGATPRSATKANDAVRVDGPRERCGGRSVRRGRQPRVHAGRARLSFALGGGPSQQPTAIDNSGRRRHLRPRGETSRSCSTEPCAERAVEPVRFATSLLVKP